MQCVASARRLNASASPSKHPSIAVFRAKCMKNAPKLSCVPICGTDSCEYVASETAPAAFPSPALAHSHTAAGLCVFFKRNCAHFHGSLNCIGGCELITHTKRIIIDFRHECVIICHFITGGVLIIQFYRSLNSD